MQTSPAKFDVTVTVVTSHPVILPIPPNERYWRYPGRLVSLGGSMTLDSL